MGTYSYVEELVVLPIIITIITSLIGDSYIKSIYHKYLSVMYNIALLSSVITVAASFFDHPLNSPWEVLLGYIVNTLYFILMPSTAVMYAIYVQFTSGGIFNIASERKKILILLSPYIIYVAILFVNIFCNGLVFSMTQEEGYVRGLLYQMPYPLFPIYAIIIVVFVIKNFKYMSKQSSIVILSTIIIAATIVIILFCNGGVLLTGLLNTICILSIHLHTLNNSKKEDSLTGTQNRLTFLNHLEKLIAKNKNFSIYIFSVRGMKHVNEQYGLSVGDKKLYNIADILLHHVRRERVFRYSGDEFAVLLPFHNEHISPVIEKIREKFKLSTQVEDNLLPIDIDIVRVDYPTFGSKAGDLIAVIDYGVHSLKNEKETANSYLYDISTFNTMRKYHSTINQINSAIKDRRFVVFYQPIYHIPTATFTQAEALIRMREKDGSLVFPNDFIDIAENTGLTIEITYQMLEQVCCDFRTLLTNQPDTTLTAISINVPYIQFIQDDMEDRFMEILEKYDIAPNQIKIEVTERMFVDDFGMMSKKMNNMIEKGFEFELDDFGIGYSNLQMSLTLPTDIIKFDRSLLLTAVSSDIDSNFFNHLIAGINIKGRKILVEGVETKEQLNWTIDSHCEYVQGYYFSKPVNFTSFSEFLLK